LPSKLLPSCSPPAAAAASHSTTANHSTVASHSAAANHSTTASHSAAASPTPIRVKYIKLGGRSYREAAAAMAHFLIYLIF
ncbi:hypothetical protein LINPERPRIM_LOCUS26296, partial [Linum perenne]